MSDPVDTTDPGSDGIPQHAAPEEPGFVADEPRPEPVLSAAQLAGAISGVILAIGGLLRLAGVWIPDDYDLQGLADGASNTVLTIAGAWSLIGPYLLAKFRARDKVTPLSDPRDAAGRRLIPSEET